MSIVFTAVCSLPKPAGLELYLGSGALPFDVELVELDVWREQTREWATGDDLAELARRIDRPWSFVAQLTCRPQTAELTEVVVHELVGKLGGFYYDDHSALLTSIVAGTGTITGDRLVESWLKLLRDPALVDTKVRALAKAQHDAAAAREPKPHADADDWSDV